MAWPLSSTNRIPISMPSHLELPVASCPSPIPLLQIAESEEARIVREFAELLDASEAYHSMSGEDAAEIECQKKSPMPTISERFMGMRSAVVTNNTTLKSLGDKLGFTTLQLSDIIDNCGPNADSRLDIVASGLLKLLGFQGKTLETSPFDLVFIHIGEGKKDGQKNAEYVNGLVGQIMHLEEQESEISSRLHLSVVLSYGPVSEGEPDLSVICKNENNSDLSLLFPRQSYAVEGRNVRDNLRYHGPMLIAQWQNGVTRKDMAGTFSFKDFKEHSGILTIPADRFIHEVAFKLWKAPKYGA
ncbi:uncharacterized protein LOC127786681 isoform X2 [Diospyros lotus]|uniref:uncharacterized protein LOC127786681 isoform X2 n=1 Tax=Diospyros lotus TaxID=55363 RepID=UPI00224E5FDC|nr:uncharacterized protein LOC127786681 isoform X2 [Diospyros lotus]